MECSLLLSYRAITLNKIGAYEKKKLCKGAV